PFDSGPILDFLARGDLPPEKNVRDPFGYASGALAFDLALPPGGSDEVTIDLPFHPAALMPAGGTASTARDWRGKPDRLRPPGPPRRGAALRHPPQQSGVRADRAGRPGAAAGDPGLCPLVDPRRRDDLGGPAAPRPHRSRPRLHRVVREVPGSRRPGS